MKKDRYRELFIEESQEHISGLKEILSKGESVTEEEINEAYRHAHSLKGMAATMGLNEIVQLSHAIENLLSEKDAGKNFGKIEEKLSTLEKILEQFESGELSTETDQRATLSGTGTTLTTPGGSRGIFRIEIFFSSSLPMPSATIFKFIRDAGKKIEIIETNQKKGDLKKGNFNNPLRMLVKGDISSIEETIKETPGILGIKVTPIDTDEISKKKIQIDSIKVKLSDLDVLLENIHQLFRLKNRIKPSLLKEDEDSFYKLEMLTERLHEITLGLRMVPLKLLEEGLRNLVVTYGSEMGKKVTLIMVGSDVRIDKNIADRLLSILTHLVKNAIYHGIEPPEEREREGKNPIGIIKIEAESKSDSLEIRISDDGRGIQVDAIREKLLQKGILDKEQLELIGDEEVIQYIFKTGFSTSKTTGVIAGRGVGLDAVKEMVEKMYGVIFVETEPGKGTTFTIRIPRALIIQNLITVVMEGNKVAIPTYLIEGVIERDQADTGEILYHGEKIPYKGREGTMFLIFKDRNKKKAFSIEEIIEMDFQLVRELSPVLRKLQYLLGYYIDEEEPVFMVHPGTLWNYLPGGTSQ